ncbi:hypothetical protein [Haloarcula litorea]|uniref:hypothetical protein n=1 Tax=Haloarcula litorea TaxID=3032579 RepID=UPI0023E8252C|nr:hypothetical protein [Halomicroarcula sp. GDY20]
MSRDRRGGTTDDRGPADRYGSVRLPSAVALLALALTQVPVAAAHGATATGGLARIHAIAIVLVGVGSLVGAVVLKRTDRVSPTTALYGVLLGVAVAVVGAVLFEGLAPDPTYTAASMPFPRSWYPPIALATSLAIAVASFAVVGLRWPTRPRYALFGTLMGLWIAYPYLFRGTAGTTHPIGYAVVLGTPVAVGYLLWRDARHAVRDVLRDPVARRFGLGLGLAIALFFVSVTGYLSVFPEEGFPHEVTVVVLPTVYQLVTWPTLEIAIPHVPFFLAVSPGLAVVVGLLSALVGLNGALVARHWRLEERAGLARGTAGSAAIVGTCTCGCCGPLVAKVALLAAGPSVAAPLYWVFVDSASPLSALFIVGSLFLFTGSVVHSIGSASGPDGPSAVTPSD